MLTRLGAPASPGDLVSALLDCHERIRSFTALAARLAAAEGVPDEEVRDAAARVHRYFSTALPLHARDEEESLLPRLRGRDPEVDRELDAMLGEHAGHGDPVGRTLAACGELARDPAALPRVAPALAAAARELEEHFLAHLDREEGVIFPAVRAHLDPAAQAEVQAEMKARRAG